MAELDLVQAAPLEAVVVDAFQRWLEGHVAIVGAIGRWCDSWGQHRQRNNHDATLRPW